METIDSGSLATYEDNVDISAKQLKELLDILPEDTEQLLIFTQCYAGNMANSKEFKDRPNTTILSGCGEGQEAKYGGYHDDAAKELRPGKGRTAKDVHDAGEEGKADEFREGGPTPKPHAADIWDEKPFTAGKIKPEDFSLEPTSEEGPIHSRHIVIYGGKSDLKKDKVREVNGRTKIDPQNGKEKKFSDAQNRDTIKENFENQKDTTVKSCGGKPNKNDPSKGEDGWDYPGNYESLKKAIEEAAEAIKKAKPKKEQFILFASDHGDGERLDEFEDRKAKKKTKTSLSDPFKPFGKDSTYAHHILQDPKALPGFSVPLDFGRSPLTIKADAFSKPLPNFKKGDFALEITAANGDQILLDSFKESVFIMGKNGVVGHNPGDELKLFFPMDKHDFVKRTFGNSLKIALLNETDTDVWVSSVAQTTGSIAGSGNRPPRKLHLCKLGLRLQRILRKLRGGK
jgi:hypothetical protein